MGGRSWSVGWEEPGWGFSRSMRKLIKTKTGPKHHNCLKHTCVESNSFKFIPGAGFYEIYCELKCVRSKFDDLVFTDSPLIYILNRITKASNMSISLRI